MRTASALGAAILFFAAAGAAQEKKLACPERAEGREHRVCEMREMNVAAAPKLTVNAAPNGGIRVVAWDRKEILVRARVEAWGASEQESRDRLQEVNVATAGAVVKATGPKTTSLGRWGEQKWSVSYEVFTPARIDLELESVNGGVGITNVAGALAVKTVNGGVSLLGVNGTVKGETVNGGVSVEMTGARWDGAGLDVKTVNGGVKLALPASYAASVEAETVNGGLSTDFEGAVREGRPRPRRMSVKLGGGGAPVRLETVNGGVSVKRKI
jgi:hypothetical protein